MARVNLFLLLAAVACALGVITAQHKARKLFIDLEAGQSAAKRLDEEFTQLQLEQGTWATHKRIEAVAARSLGMGLPEPGATRVITLDEPETAIR
ncbi:MAG TPA: cell division protein FtsL [Usitatibacteraceae bacterium]|nr:cell division protein FtsL [Usitatibacteraceae bacterium]